MNLDLHHLSNLGTTLEHRNSMATTKITAFRTISPMLMISRDPDCAIPTTTASTIMPIMSSITAAPMMILDSLVFMTFRSFITLAVIPTLVATMAAPRKRAWYMLPS